MAVRGRVRQRLFVAARGDRRWAAWLEDDRLVEFHQEAAGEKPRAGDIYLGRIVRVDKGLDAAFVDIARKQAAFLPLSGLATPAVEGARLAVQIEREERDDKGARVTARLALAGARTVLVPGGRGVSVSERIPDKSERSRLAALMRTIAESGEGCIVRAAAVGAKEKQLYDEFAALRASRQELAERERRHQPPAVLLRQPPIDIRLLRDHGLRFDEIVYSRRAAAAEAEAWCRTMLPELTDRIADRRGAEWHPAPGEIVEQLADAMEPRIDLRPGGSIVIEPTEALTVIDVNADSAGTAAVGTAGERALLRTNLAAADVIGQQLRLRNIGGIVVVDFIDLRDVHARRQVVERLREATAMDSAPVWVGAMSRLGLVELTRRRRGPTLADAMLRPCTGCEGRGRIPGDDALSRLLYEV
jgi:Rne/Rng family ribonuclease